MFKEKLTTGPALIIPKCGFPFVVYTETSLLGHGGLLTQIERVVSYISDLLQSHEVNYPTYNLELDILVFLNTLKILF